MNRSLRATADPSTRNDLQSYPCERLAAPALSTGAESTALALAGSMAIAPVKATWIALVDVYFAAPVVAQQQPRWEARLASVATAGPTRLVWLGSPESTAARDVRRRSRGSLVPCAFKHILMSQRWDVDPERELIVSQRDAGMHLVGKESAVWWVGVGPYEWTLAFGSCHGSISCF